jgi:hypothetical protein
MSGGRQYFDSRPARRVRWFISLDGNYPSEKASEGAARALISQAKKRWTLCCDDGQTLRLVQSGYVGIDDPQRRQAA